MGRLALDDIRPLLLAELAWPRAAPRAGQRIPVYVYAIQHPRGLILFDTGVGSGADEVDREWHPRVFSLDDALEGIGRKAEDVVGIAVCHLHFDHCGLNPRFPGTPIYAQRPEYEATRQPDYTVPEWVDFPGANYKLIEGDVEPWPGIHLLSTPGHTPGHQSAWLDTAQGGVLLAGQAVYDLAELQGTAPLESADEAYVRSVERLRSLKPRRTYVSHDERVAEAPASRR